MELSTEDLFTLSDNLYDRINKAYLEAEELESLDLNDCAGGACKL